MGPSDAGKEKFRLGDGGRVRFWDRVTDGPVSKERIKTREGNHPNLGLLVQRSHDSKVLAALRRHV